MNTKTSQADAFARAVYGDAPRTGRGERWRRRRLALAPVLAVVAVIVAVAVITDLPQHPSLAGERAAASSLLAQVNTDLAPCTFSLSEAAALLRQVKLGALSRSDRARVGSLLTDDAAACSYTSDNVNNLAAIEEPGTGAGRYLAQVVALAQTWTTSDALGAINDLITLDTSPHDARARTDLSARQRFLDQDRAAARVALGKARSYLHGGVPALKIPEVQLPD